MDHSDASTFPPPLFKVGDQVNWTNDYGVDWGLRTVVEVLEPDKFGHRYMITPKEAHWMYVRQENLTPYIEPETQYGNGFGSFS